MTIAWSSAGGIGFQNGSTQGNAVLRRKLRPPESTPGNTAKRRTLRLRSVDVKGQGSPLGRESACPRAAELSHRCLEVDFATSHSHSAQWPCRPQRSGAGSDFAISD